MNAKVNIKTLQSIDKRLAMLEENVVLNDALFNITVEID